MKKQSFILVLIIGCLVMLLGSNFSFAATGTGGGRDSHKEMLNGGGTTSKPSTSTSKPSKPNYNKEDKDPDPPQPVITYSYPEVPKSKTQTISSFTATLLPQKTFYDVGDFIKLDGNRDVEEIESWTQVYKVTYTNGKETNRKLQSEKNKKTKTEYYAVKLEFKGFRVSINNNELSKTVNEDEDTLNIFTDSLRNTTQWSTEKLMITKLVPGEFLEYDPSRGVVTGKVIATSALGGKKEFIIPFSFQSVEERIPDTSTTSLNEFTATLSPIKTFYKLGEFIKLDGERKVEETTSWTRVEKVEYIAGVETGRVFDRIENEQTVPKYYFVELEFKGFRVSINDNELSKTVNEDADTSNIFKDSLRTTMQWGTENLKITELVPEEFLDYDSTTGVASGKVIATSESGEKEEFIIPFLFTPVGYSVDVYSDNPYLGTVSDSLAGRFGGEKISVSSFEKVKGAFKYWYKINADGTIEILSYNKNYNFTMPAANLVLVAHFEYEVTTYKLYITSNNPDWGTAWTLNDSSFQETYVEKAVPNKIYDIRYRPNEGYRFVRWEYSPNLENDLELNGQLKMPANELTVMAVFEKIEDDKENNLIVTVNNPEWGTAGDSVENAVPGTEYTIWYQAAPGYYFAGWVYSPSYMENPFISNSTVVMPDKTVTITAVFAPVTDLYDVTTRVEPADGGTIVGSIPTQAAEGQVFEANININSGYIIDYWYYMDGENKVIVSREQVVRVEMPNHSIELVAVLKKLGQYNLYVTSNNPDWGEAWTTPDDSDEHIWKRVAIEGKEYSINALPKNGYDFVEFVYKPEIENPVEKDGKIKMPAHDVTVTAIFKEAGPDFTENPTLYISVNNPEWGVAYVVDGSGKPCYANTKPMDPSNSFTAKVNETYEIFYEAKPGYKFVGWYTSPDIDLNPFADNITMPSQNLTLTAFFSLDINKYSLTVVSDPDVGGATEGSRDEVYSGGEYFVEATPNTGYKFEYWYYTDSTGKKVIIREENEFYFVMPSHNVTLYAKFDEKSGGEGGGGDNDEDDPIEPSDPIPPEELPTPIGEENVTKSFKVISVRDLRWKDYFVDEYGNYLHVNALSIPDEESEFVVKHPIYPQNDILKTGYAVEFELKTIMVPEEYARLVINPEIYKGNTKLQFYQIKDKLSGELLSASEKYSKIIIEGRDKDTTDSFQTKATVVKVEHNGVQYDEITWNWLYYLPAELSDVSGNNFDQNLTVKFNVELYDTRKSGKIMDYVVALNKNRISNWSGKVFQYSATESLLDDIYNNAT